MEKQKKAEEKIKEKQCPFDKNLRCEDCRLFLPFPYGMGKKACVFFRMND